MKRHHSIYRENLVRPTETKAFTLVEIMIAIVLIGLLAAMAIPGFNLVRQKTYRFLMNNDARQLAGAAQQYMTEFTENTFVPISIETQTGEVIGPLNVYVKQISKGMTVGDYDGQARGDEVAFTMSNYYVDGAAEKNYDSSGKLID